MSLLGLYKTLSLLFLAVQLDRRNIVHRYFVSYWNPRVNRLGSRFVELKQAIVDNDSLDAAEEEVGEFLECGEDEQPTILTYELCG